MSHEGVVNCRFTCGEELVELLDDLFGMECTDNVDIFRSMLFGSSSSMFGFICAHDLSMTGSLGFGLVLGVFGAYDDEKEAVLTKVVSVDDLRRSRDC